MAIVAGNYDASALATTLLKADQMWSDDMMKADFVANADTYVALKAEQNARVEVLEDPEKDRIVKVFWINDCANAVDDCDEDDCDLSGAQLGSDSKTYALSVCKKYNFTVDEMTFRANNYSMADAVAKGFLKADKALSEAVSATGVARLESFKGVNAVPDGIGVINGGTGDTDIASANFNERLFAYLYRVGIQNQMSNPFILSGSNLFEDRLVTLLAEKNANGKGAAELFKLIRTYFDLFGIDSANSPDLKTYLINRGSIAFASKAYYGAVPTKYKEQDRWSIASRNLEGVRFDVHYTNRCSGVTMLHDFSLKAYYDYFINPFGCEATRTGVLAFNKTA